MNENKNTEISPFNAFLENFRNDDGELNNDNILEGIIKWSFKKDSEDYNTVYTYIQMLDDESKSKLIDKINYKYMNNLSEWVEEYEKNSEFTES